MILQPEVRAWAGSLVRRYQPPQFLETVLELGAPLDAHHTEWPVLATHLLLFRSSQLFSSFRQDFVPADWLRSPLMRLRPEVTEGPFSGSAR